MNFEVDDEVIFSVLQEDPLEFFKLLWLNPIIVTSMKLDVQTTQEGLVAVNQSQEIVLRMRTWNFEYVGDRSRTSLSDEIPTLEGTDLIIRKDYYKILCGYFKNRPTYFSCRIQRDLV